MASITYKPQPGDPETVKWGGHEFKAGEAVDVGDNPTMLAKAKGNPSFEASGSDDEQRQAEVLGNYRDPNDGREVTLIQQPRSSAYLGGASAPTGPVPPSRATQGSVAEIAAANSAPAGRNMIKEVYGAEDEAQLASGEYEGAPESKGPLGTESSRRGPGRPRKGE